MDNRTILLDAGEGFVSPDEVNLANSTKLNAVMIDDREFNAPNENLTERELDQWKEISRRYAEYRSNCEGFREPDPLSVIVRINMELHDDDCVTAQTASDAMEQLERGEWEWFEDLNDAFFDRGLYHVFSIWHECEFPNGCIDDHGYWVRF